MQNNNSNVNKISYANISEIKKLPFITNLPTEKQVIYNYPYFDENEKQFLCMFLNGNKEFNYIVAGSLDWFFYAKSKTDIEKDLFINFFDILIRNYSYTFAISSIEAIGNDILNLSAIFEKYFIFLNYMSGTPEKYKMILVRTEIEYFFGVIRSLYDILQILIKHFVKYYKNKDLPKKVMPKCLLKIHVN